MAWADVVGPETLTESAAGDGAYMAAGVAMNPRETIHFHFERKDSPTEPWGTEVYASLDDVDYGDQPIATRRWTAGDTHADLVVTGPLYVKARVVNVDSTPVDVVSVDVTYSRDQVSL